MMIFKLFFELIPGDNMGSYRSECRVVAVENGSRLEQRIDTIISNFKSDGFKSVFLRDCFNISEPDRNPWGKQ